MTEKEQNIVKNVTRMAEKIKTHIGNSAKIKFNPEIIEDVVLAGWEAIPVGTVIYRDEIFSGQKSYTKVSEDSAKDQDGKVVEMNDKQKRNMTGTYALLRTFNQ